MLFAFLRGSLAARSPLDSEFLLVNRSYNYLRLDFSCLYSGGIRFTYTAPNDAFSAMQ